MSIKEDITTRGNIIALINRFYDKVKEDKIIGHIFNQIIGDDWSHHLPVMYQFWETVLLNQPGYNGNPIKKHIDVDKQVPLKQEHYDRWIILWSETVNELFEGPNAEEIKKRAVLMMNLIKTKIEWSRNGTSIE